MMNSKPHIELRMSQETDNGDIYFIKIKLTFVIHLKTLKPIYATYKS